MVLDKKKYQKDWYSKNREHVLAYAKEYSKTHSDKIKEYNKTYKRPEESKVKQRLMAKKYKENNKAKHIVIQRNSYLKKKYGITIEEYGLLVEKSGNKCAICQSEFLGKNLPCVDHDHKNNKVRGLLCRYCNASIGQLGDTAEDLRKAYTYLLNYEGTL